MNKNELITQCRLKQSGICFGLDPDLSKMPPSAVVTKVTGQKIDNTNELVYWFLRSIVDAVAPYGVSFKPNLAFFEGQGVEQALQDICFHIKTKHTDMFLIVDGKRGDIGNTSQFYAKRYFGSLHADGGTVYPYMGQDSLRPFVDHKYVDNPWLVLLALTSNAGSNDFQMLADKEDVKLFEQVIVKARQWFTSEQLMFVVGATKPEWFADIRWIAPDYFLLVPGVGAQGGSMEPVVEHGANKDWGLLFNASRSVLYASSSEDYVEKAVEEAQALQKECARLMALSSFFNEEI